jgi:hypothetical protein
MDGCKDINEDTYINIHVGTDIFRPVGGWRGGWINEWIDGSMDFSGNNFINKIK